MDGQDRQDTFVLPDSQWGLATKTQEFTKNFYYAGFSVGMFTEARKVPEEYSVYPLYQCEYIQRYGFGFML